MRIGKVVMILVAGTALSLTFPAHAQAPAGGRSAAPAGRAGAAAGSAPQVKANLLQLMRGTLYPESNVIFSAQDQNPSDVPQAKDPSTAVNPLASSYGKWEAVENSAIAMTEIANLLMLPGRKCANGRDVPIKNADWPKFVQGLRDAGMTAYEAAKTKNQDKIVDAADVMTTACANCHDKYREKPMAERCQ